LEPGATSDIVYGNSTAMEKWFNIYMDFIPKVNGGRTPHQSESGLGSFSGIDTAPLEPAPEDYPHFIPCSSECILAWYLEKEEFRFNVSWEWA
jgi:hypothetical protein